MPGFRAVPFTGVIYVMAEAARRGYMYGHPDWCNLGQGMPETGDLPGAPPRVLEAPISTADQEYAPVAGIPELRAAVAALYNYLYRQNKPSQYTADNVCICGGGRLGLTRTVAALGDPPLRRRPRLDPRRRLRDALRHACFLAASPGPLHH